jgi:hypothetical protein
MAQTRKKRRRKHRGTQGGGLDRRGPRGRPRTREEAKSRARQRQASKGGKVDRRDLAPTWGGAFKRGLFGAGIFFLLFWLAFQRPVASALALSLVMLGMYVPMGYYIDRFMYRRRLRQQQAARAAKKQQG